MADYFTPTVIQQTIPSADMTPLERLVLGQMFDAEPDGDGVYFSSETGPNNFVFLRVSELKSVYAQSAGATSILRDHLADAAENLGDGVIDVELDMSGMSWEFIFQDIVRRSKTLRYVTAVAAFTCSKMRPDGFGGMAILITADAVKGKSTNDIVEEFLAETEVEAAPHAA